MRASQTMYLQFRALSSVLIRKLSPGGIPRAPAQARANSSPGIFSRITPGAMAARPGRPLHTFRDLAVGDGSYVGALSVAAWAVVIGSLYAFRKDAASEDVRKEGTLMETSRVTGKKTTKEMPVIQVFKDGNMDDAAIREMFKDKDGKMMWLQYVDYLTFGKTFGNVRKQDDEDGSEEEQQDPEYEAAMKARFEEWMKEFGKTYRNEEETAMRYELFKQSAKKADKYHGSKGIALSGLADITDEEWKLMTADPRDDQYWEEYVESLKAIKAHCKLTGESSGRASVIYKQLGKDYCPRDQEGCSIEEALAKREARCEEARRLHFEEKARKKIGK